MFEDDPDVPLQWQRILIRTSGTVSATEIAPFLDEVHKYHQWVDVSLPAPGNEPPAADITEIVLLITLTGGAAYIKGFAEAWGGEDARALRRRLIEATNRGRRSRHEGSERTFMPLEFNIGRARYIVREPISEDEFQVAIQALPTSVQELADQGFLIDGEEQARRLFRWDSEGQRWK